MPIRQPPEGCSLPLIGLGTFQPSAAPNSVVKDSVLCALKSGYRHVDTAFIYDNGKVEQAVGQAVREWGGDRKELWIVTKLSNAHHKPEDVANALELSLTNMEIDYVDLYLMHYPIAYHREGEDPKEWRIARNKDGTPKIDYHQSYDYSSTWHAMENLVYTGKVRKIGLSNFSILKMKKLLRTARIKPYTNQIELHPYLPQFEMVQYCQEHGILVTAHSPLGGRPVSQVALNCHLPGPMMDATIATIAAKYQRTPADILLQWATQRGIHVVPKSYNTDNIQANLAALQKPDLFQEDMDMINSILAGKPQIRFMDPSKYWGFNIFNENEDEPR